VLPHCEVPRKQSSYSDQSSSGFPLRTTLSQNNRRLDVSISRTRSLYSVCTQGQVWCSHDWVHTARAPLPTVPRERCHIRLLAGIPSLIRVVSPPCPVPSRRLALLETTAANPFLAHDPPISLSWCDLARPRSDSSTRCPSKSNSSDHPWPRCRNTWLFACLPCRFAPRPTAGHPTARPTKYFSEASLLSPFSSPSRSRAPSARGSPQAKSAVNVSTPVDNVEPIPVVRSESTRLALQHLRTLTLNSLSFPCLSSAPSQSLLSGPASTRYGRFHPPTNAFRFLGFIPTRHCFPTHDFAPPDNQFLPVVLCHQSDSSLSFFLFSFFFGYGLSHVDYWYSSVSTN
jgi:hypothetical protein